MCLFVHFLRIGGTAAMPDGRYYRTQAQLLAKLALTNNDPALAARYNVMALEHLAMAEVVEPNAGQEDPSKSIGNTASDMDRD
jgi:hypothetical protein